MFLTENPGHSTSKYVTKVPCTSTLMCSEGGVIHSKSKSDFWRNLNFRYRGKLELSVLVAIAGEERRTARD